MLSSTEHIPEPDDADDEVKDFAYYAELAKNWLYEAERFTPQIFNPRAFEHAMKAADVYSRLAAAAATVKRPANEF